MFAVASSGMLLRGPGGVDYRALTAAEPVTKDTDEISVGRIIRSVLTGRPDDLTALEMQAVTRGSDTGGGYLLTPALSTRFIDLARARSVVIAAGAQTLPMDTAELSLALSIPATWSEGQPNGLLQSWEIFESLRLSADLVALSGCDTALGAQVEGEGLSSLTRAFLHAGAQSVLASLWSVNDRSTAELMTRFYTHLGNGKSG